MGPDSSKYSRQVNTILERNDNAIKNHWNSTLKRRIKLAKKENEADTCVKKQKINDELGAYLSKNINKFSENENEPEENYISPSKSECLDTICSTPEKNEKTFYYVKPDYCFAEVTNCLTAQKIIKSIEDQALLINN